ncbi:MAG: citrate lyase subunit gamma, partial [Bacilli bacterium]|nr:citrate lyase subunit gamma [Bacilli bacterium]
MKNGVCGSLESNDCLITVESSETTEIIIESIVYDFYGDQIERVIADTLKQLNISNVKVFCVDRGALDYTI